MPVATITILKAEYDRLRAEEKLSLEHRVLQSERIERLLQECVNADASYRHMRDRYEELARENHTLRLYYKNWREQQDVVARLREALAPIAELGRNDAVKASAERDASTYLLIGRTLHIPVSAKDFERAATIHTETELNPAAEKPDE